MHDLSAKLKLVNERQEKTKLWAQSKDYSCRAMARVHQIAQPRQ